MWKDALREIAKKLKDEINFYRTVYKHPKTPFIPKLLLWTAIGYALLPFDVIPDFIPVLGYLDDLIIVPGLILMAMKLIPQEVIRECREGASNSN